MRTSISADSPVQTNDQWQDMRTGADHTAYSKMCAMRCIVMVSEANHLNAYHIEMR